jgi:hypothetical protein
VTSSSISRVRKLKQPQGAAARKALHILTFQSLENLVNLDHDAWV